MSNDGRPQYALLSVYDKTGVVEFAKQLQSAGFALLSTGGTASVLQRAGLVVTEVSALTGVPERFGGRVKTLHPTLLGGILFRRDHPEDVQQAKEAGIPEVSLVVCNLYPFAETVAQPDRTHPQVVEQIDIGGPTMVRAAAKNAASVAVVTDPRDYPCLAEELESRGEISLETRNHLAQKAFQHTARYEASIGAYFRSLDPAPVAEAGFSEVLQPAWRKSATLRYGENPHQSAAWYVGEATQQFQQLQGKALSYNNMIDMDAAFSCVFEEEHPTAAIIKHTNPCGMACSTQGIEEAFSRALACDPLSAFGGIVAVNRPVEEALASALLEIFVEVVLAPAFSEGALRALASKKNLRLITTDFAALSTQAHVRHTRFGVLVQKEGDVSPEVSWQTVTHRQPSPEEWEGMRFVWSAVRRVTSNAIVIGDRWQTCGIGAGQMSRIDAVNLAISKARTGLQGKVLASDAFFPFPDGVEAAAAAGISAVIQPGGSKRDAAVIEAANANGIAMVFTGTRYFRH